MAAFPCHIHVHVTLTLVWGEVGGGGATLYVFFLSIYPPVINARPCNNLCFSKNLGEHNITLDLDWEGAGLSSNYLHM